MFCGRDQAWAKPGNLCSWRSRLLTITNERTRTGRQWSWCNPGWSRMKPRRKMSPKDFAQSRVQEEADNSFFPRLPGSGCIKENILLTLFAIFGQWQRWQGTFRKYCNLSCSSTSAISHFLLLLWTCKWRTKKGEYNHETKWPRTQRPLVVHLCNNCVMAGWQKRPVLLFKNLNWALLVVYCAIKGYLF